MSTRRPAIDAALLAQVLRRYPALGTFEGITANALSVNTAACLFKTSRGVYFAKRYDPRVRATAAVTAEHAIIRALMASDVPTPAVHPNERGDTLTWLAETPYALFDRARGEDRYGEVPVFAPYHTHAEAEAAGAMLARYHRRLATMARPPARPFAGLTAQFEAWHAPSLEAGLVPLLAAAPQLPAFLATQPAWASTLASLERRHPQLQPRLAELPRGILHGDWIKRNLFWSGSEVADVIDFDLWNHGILAYDLALALLPTGFNWPLLLKGEGAPDAEAMRAFLAGYAAVRALEPAERELLPLLMEVARFEFYLSGVATALAARNTDQVALFWDVLVGGVKWFDAHPEWRAALGS